MGAFAAKPALWNATSVLRPAWASQLLCIALDAFFWLALYGSVSTLRKDAAYDSAFLFLFVDFLQLAVIGIALFVIGGYERQTDMRTLAYTSEHLLAVLTACCVASLLIYGIAAFDHTMRPSRGAVLISFAIFSVGSLLYRRGISACVFAHSAREVFLVLGAGSIAQEFYESYRGSANRQRLRFVDLDHSRTGQPIAGEGSPIVESDVLAHLENIDAENRGIILAERAEYLDPLLLERLVRLHFERTPIYTIESFYETHWRRVPVHTIDPIWPLQVGFQLARNSAYCQLKRLFDIAFSVAALILLMPLLMVLALLTWVDSGRPILFAQTRVGRERRLFTIYKFRTMHHRPAQTEGTGDLYTRANDVRITPLGAYLRKLRLDELPQLWNVLCGDMSLIGPRAEWVKCAERYEEKIPCYHFRHLVKPGITGWAQVNYPYGECEADAVQKLKFDLYYIRHYSLKLDAMIILKTLHIMLFGKGR